MICFTLLVSCNSTTKKTETNSANHQEEAMDPVSTLAAKHMNWRVSERIRKIKIGKEYA
jgi:hypothetical protein